MKFSTIATIVATTIRLAAAHPHHVNAHLHLHKRTLVHQVITVYEIDGQEIPAHQAAEGLKNGTYVLTDPDTTTSIAVASPTAHVSHHKAHKHHHHHHKSTSTPSPSTGATGLDAVFPSGELDCSTFPSEYGAVPLDYLGIGGWSGIQSPSQGFSSITTVEQSMCAGGDCCGEGDYCSYACPAGYQKSQWPTTQGASGQSVGGIVCQGGKLHLTNPSLSNKLCMKGVSQVTVMVQNSMSEVAAICRTDYPGTESETIPVSANPGSTAQLACPDAANYYTWQGAQTSAQYYLNPAGIPTSKACQWGNPGDDFGNYAPINLGVGYSNGAAWLAIFQNAPTTNQLLQYDVELVGDNGGYDNMIGRCKYSNGQYCSGDDYTSCNSKGCTVNVGSGTATYVLTPRS